MGLIATLKWLWDTRSDEEKAYDVWDKITPLHRKTQTMKIFIKDLAEPVEVTFSIKDRMTGFGTWRVTENFNDCASEWLDARGKNGIRIDDVWYAPEQIVRIECGDIETSDITE